MYSIFYVNKYHFVLFLVAQAVAAAAAAGGAAAAAGGAAAANPCNRKYRVLLVR